MEQTGKISVLKLDGADAQRVDDVLVHEQHVTLFLEEERILDTVCSPGLLCELSYGHLLASGWIQTSEAVLSVDAASDEREIHVRLADKPTDQPTEPHAVESRYVVLDERLLTAAHDLSARGELFQSTGGSHMAALVIDAAPSIVVEDISRTCALEKALGKALLGGANLARSLLFLTSRVPMAFVQAAARAGIPIIAAVSAPTYEAVQEAQRLGICLCGFVRNGRLNAYSHAWRVGL